MPTADPIDLVYVGAGLDRAGAERRDEAWVQARLIDAEARFVPIWRAWNLIAGGDPPMAAVLQGAGAAACLAAAGPVALLGLEGRRAWFACDLSHLEEEALGSILAAASGDARFMDLRRVGAALARPQAALLAYARGVMHWHLHHRFCGDCGAPTVARHGGHMRACTRPECGREHFPRTDPAVIMLVTLPAPKGCPGEARCLLARQPHWPPGMYSSLAGFVEPGESLEEAVRREVMEETGIPVDAVIYRASQPWPFPSSLMLGFRAVAMADTIRVDGHELEDARWFTRADVAAFDKADLRLSRPDSIARWLIEDWLADDA